LAIFSADWPSTRRLTVRRWQSDRGKVTEADLQEGAQACAERLGLARLDENVGETPGREDGDVGQRFGTPAMITSAWPNTIWSCPALIACVAEAQARFTE